MGGESAALPEWIETNVPLAPHTTLGLGGPARYFTTAADEPALVERLRWAAARGLPVHVLGGGSNTVFADAGFDGLVVHVGLRGIALARSGEHVLVTAAAGECWSALVDFCVDQGLGGIECLAGIPGQVGATPIQNVGAYGQEIGDVLWSVDALERGSLARVRLAGAECELGYRQSRFKRADRERFVILTVTLRLRAGARPVLRYPELEAAVRAAVDLEALAPGAPALRAIRDQVVRLRRQKSMVVDPEDPESRSAGSFFVNPVLGPAALAALRARLPEPQALPAHRAAGGTKVSAAWLIEQAGFRRGYARRGVAVSSRHALALVNRGGTTTALLELAWEIQQAVRARFGIALELEPTIVGPDCSAGVLASGSSAG